MLLHRTVKQAGARSYSTAVVKIGGRNGPITACLHHNPPHSPDVMLMRTVEKAQPQTCPLSSTAEGGERARISDTETALGNLMMQPEKDPLLTPPCHVAVYESDACLSFFSPLSLF